MSFERLKDLYKKLLAMSRSAEAVDRRRSPHNLDLHEIRRNIDWFLYRAVFKGHVGIVHLLIRLDISGVNVTDDTVTAVHRAANTGQLRMANSLFRIYDRTNHTDRRTGLSHLHVACMTANVKMVWQYLDQPDCDVNAACQGQAESYPLNLAVFHYLKSEEEQERVRLEAEAVAPVKDYNRYIDMMSVDHNPLATIELLLKSGANPNLPNKDESSLLVRAIRANREELIMLLLKYKADPNTPDKLSKRRPLDEAMSLNDRQAVAYIVANPRNINHLSPRERGQLCRAAVKYAERTELDPLEFEELASIDVDTVPRVLESRLSHDPAKLYTGLLRYGADPNTLASTGRMPRLDKPTTTRIIEALLRAGAHPCAWGSNGRTPLQRAISYNYFTIVEKLLQWGAFPTKESKDGVRPLEEAVKCLDVDAVELLFQQDATAEIFNEFNRQRRALVTEAVKANQVKLIRLLIDKGLDPYVCDHIGRTLLDEAMVYNRPELLEMLLTKGYTPNVEGQAPPLTVAVRFNYTEIARVLLEKGRANAKVFNFTNERFMLERVVKKGNVELIELLLKHGMDANACDKYGETLLHKAVRVKQIAVAGMLLAHQVDPNIAGGQKDRTPLHVAVDIKSIELARILLEEARDIAVDKLDKEGKTAIHMAAKNLDLEMIELLLKHGATVASLNEPTNRDVLGHVIQMGGFRICEVLVKAGVDPNVLGTSQNSLQHEAVIHRKCDILEMLLMNGANPSLKNALTVPPLYVAISGNQTALAKALLRYDADTRSLNGDDRVFVDRLIKAGNAEIIEALLKDGVDPNKPRSMLHQAIERNQEDLIELLLRNGANPNQLDELDRLPLDKAKKLKRWRTVELLEKHSAWTANAAAAVRSLTEDGDKQEYRLVVTVASRKVEPPKAPESPSKKLGAKAPDSPSKRFSPKSRQEPVKAPDSPSKRFSAKSRQEPVKAPDSPSKKPKKK